MSCSLTASFFSQKLHNKRSKQRQELAVGISPTERQLRPTFCHLCCDACWLDLGVCWRPFLLANSMVTTQARQWNCSMKKEVRHFTCFSNFCIEIGVNFLDEKQRVQSTAELVRCEQDVMLLKLMMRATCRPCNLYTVM